MVLRIVADAAIRQLERDVAAGSATDEQLWAMQCRSEGHQWKNMVGSPCEWLYVHFCKRCLATRGRQLSQVRLPKIFTISDASWKHVFAGEVGSMQMFKARCGRRFETEGQYHSTEMLKQRLGFLQNCTVAPDCKHCLHLMNLGNLGNETLRRRVAQVYKDIFRPVSFALVANRLEIHPNFYQTGDLSLVTWLDES